MRQPGQHIYIAGDSATIARLLWGLAQSLPRTLTIMGDMTFSTYEVIDKPYTGGVYYSSDEMQLQPTIIGTCWRYAQDNELPLSSYHPEGSNGFALNCYTGRKTPLTPNKFTARFASYAVDCLLEENDHAFSDLRAILAQAEREQCKELYHFVRIFNAYQSMLSQEDILSLLRPINENLETIAENTMLLLADLARLRRPNVQKSIVYRIAENRYWWESSCLPELTLFYTFLMKYMSLPLPADIEAVLESLQSAINELGERIAAQVNTAIHNNQEESMYFWTDMLEKSAPIQHTQQAWLALLNTIEMEDLDQPAYLLWWKICGARVVTVLHQHATGAIIHALDDPLNHFGSIIANKIQIALHHNDTWALGAWSQAFVQVAQPSREAVAWIYLLHTLATNPYTPLYWEWWNMYGKQGVEALGRALQEDGQRQLDQFRILCNSIVNNTVMIVRRANPASGIQGTGRQEWLFWHDVLSALMPQNENYEQGHAAWLILWGSLWPYVFYPAFVQWWHPRGMRVAQAIRTFAEQHPNSDITNDLAAFIFETILPLTLQQIEHMLEQDRTDPEQEAAWGDFQHQLFLLLEILAICVPSQYQLEVWHHTPTDQSLHSHPNLIQELARTLQGQGVDEIYDWEAYRFLLETWNALPEQLDCSQIIPWLNVSWQGLGNLLAAPSLPDTWKEQAIEHVLSTPIALQPHQVIALVAQHQEIFMTVLEHQLQTQEYAQQALTFFRYLTDFHYPYKPYLLSQLIQASSAQPEQVSTLMQHSNLSPEEMILLLENHSTQIIAHTPWPDEIRESIQLYLRNLEMTALARPAARAFLQHLTEFQHEQPESLSPEFTDAILGWNSICALMEPGADVTSWLRNEAINSGRLAHIALEHREQLLEGLTGALVKVLRYETSILEALHNLGSLYAVTEQETASTPFPPTHSLLRDLANQAGTAFGHEQPPLRLLPYLKIILVYAQELPGKQKEHFIDGCLHPLLLHVDEQEQERIDAHSALWFPELQSDWQSYRQRQPLVHEEAVIAHFRNMLRSGDVDSITRAYQRFLRDVRYPATRISAQERERAQLARDIVIAYNRQDQEMLLQAHQNVLHSAYHESIRYTPAIRELIDRLSRTHRDVQPAAPAIPMHSPFPSSPTFHSYPGLPSAGDITELKTIDQSELLQSALHPSVMPLHVAKADTNDEDTEDGEYRENIEHDEQVAARIQEDKDEQEQRYADDIEDGEETEDVEEREKATDAEEFIIGTVLDEPIELTQLEHINALKRLYLDFRVHHLELRLNNLPGPEKKFYSYEIKTLKEQLEANPQALRAYALDDLVDDVFIRQYIEELLDHESKLSPTHFALHPQIKAKFIAYDPSAYHSICTEHRLSEEESEEVLSLFRRRELLAHYLFQKQQKTSVDQLERWLQEEKQQQHGQIELDLELAGLRLSKPSKPTQAQRPRVGFLSALRRR